MKLPVIILFMLLSFHVYAQRINGLVFDNTTKLPLPGAVVKKGTSIQSTTSKGFFMLTNVHVGDSVRITLIGYKVYYLVPRVINNDTLRVYLTPNTIVLNNVNIRAMRDRKLDSLQNRREFAASFAYTAPTFLDIFERVNRYYDPPNDFIHAGNSTTQIVTLTPLSLISLLSKNNTPQSKLHRLVLTDEKADYIIEHFPRKRIVELTKLKGDSLENFIYLYRPEMERLKTMSTYDVDVYIKKSFANYRSAKNKDSGPFTTK